MEKSRYVYFVLGCFVAFVYGFIYTPRTGFYLATALALLKEFEEQDRYGMFDWRDTIVAWFGSSIGFIAAAILALVLTGHAP